MIEALPTHWLALVGVVFLLGLKHGLDPDHLAAIDGLTRFNARARPVLARWSGLLFSAGHGVVVTLVAIAVATVATEWKAPRWLEDAGTWISIAFLATLGLANLAAVVRSPRRAMRRPRSTRRPRHGAWRFPRAWWSRSRCPMVSPCASPRRRPSMDRAKKPKGRRMRLSSVANSVRLTKAFSENEYEMGISALAARLGLAKSTVHRLATTLVEYDILEQNS